MFSRADARVAMGVPSFNRFDERTHVGRQNLEFEQHNMYRRILSAKSSVDTRLARPTRPRSATARPQSARAEMDEFREVREAARRINDLSLKKRGPTFSSPPKTITEDLSRRLSENRRAYRAADPARHYHAKQIANMQRRIAEQGTLAERKKNVYDVRVHPVVLRKPSGKPPPWGFGSGSLSSAAKKGRPSTATLAGERDVRYAGGYGGGGGMYGGDGGDGGAAREQMASRRAIPRAASAPFARPKAAPPARIEGVEHMRPTRKASKDHPAYQTLRKKLLHEIVRKDASEEDVEAIFADARREQSGSQHKHVLALVIEDLKVELELEQS